MTTYNREVTPNTHKLTYNPNITAQSINIVLLYGSIRVRVRLTSDGGSGPPWRYSSVAPYDYTY